MPESDQCCSQNDDVYQYLLAKTPPGKIAWNFDKILGFSWTNMCSSCASLRKLLPATAGNTLRLIYLRALFDMSSTGRSHPRNVRTSSKCSGSLS